MLLMCIVYWGALLGLWSLGAMVNRVAGRPLLNGARIAFLFMLGAVGLRLAFVLENLATHDVPASGQILAFGGILVEALLPILWARQLSKGFEEHQKLFGFVSRMRAAHAR